MAINRVEHPELQDGEVFYCNVVFKKNYDEMNFRTKRIGKIAYSEPGRKIRPLAEGGGPFPVFVQESELKEWGLL